MAKVSVSEAAGILGLHVQRVHQLIASGDLRAERVGRQWIVDDADLARHDRRAAGRPLSARSAWNLVVVAAELGPSPAPAKMVIGREVSPPDLSRARARLRDLFAKVDESFDERGDENSVAEAAGRLRALMRNRARRLEFNASRRDLEDLRADRRIRMAGVSLPASGMASGAFVEAYVANDELAQLVSEYLLVDANPVEANVVVHQFDPALAGLEPDPSNWLLVAADLAEHHRPREMARAIDLVRAADRPEGSER